MLIDDMNRRINDISKLKNILERKIKEMPKGRVRIKRRGKAVYFYHIPDNGIDNGNYLHKIDMDMVKALVQKDYMGKVVCAADKEVKALKLAINSFPKITAEDIYMTLPEERRALINPIKRPDDEFVRDWLSEEYLHKGFKEREPYYETMNGERVRSKSEQIIADHLKQAGIPYKYEYPIVINGELIHPDFKILRVSDRKEIYLEHCGRVDKPDYSDDMVIRVNNYAMNGIIIGDNLYLLFETLNNPLDVRVLNRMIEEQFR